jgi:hypothetical protein
MFVWLLPPNSESSSPIAFKFRHNVPLEYERLYIYRTSISGEEAVEPETFSGSSSPIAFKFCHIVAFEYARVYIYGHLYLARKRWSLKQSPKVLQIRACF